MEEAEARSPTTTRTRRETTTPMLEEDDNDDMEEYLAAGSSDHAGNPPVSQPHACWDTQENNFKVPLGWLTYRQI